MRRPSAPMIVTASSCGMPAIFSFRLSWVPRLEAMAASRSGVMDSSPNARMTARNTRSTLCIARAVSSARTVFRVISSRRASSSCLVCNSRVAKAAAATRLALSRSPATASRRESVALDCRSFAMEDMPPSAPPSSRIVESCTGSFTAPGPSPAQKPSPSVIANSRTMMNSEPRNQVILVQRCPRVNRSFRRATSRPDPVSTPPANEWMHDETDASRHRYRRARG